jgi:ethanolamine utilization protein EutA
MPERVTLVGLDFGTTTSSAVVAEADVARSAGTGRVEFGELSVRYRSPMQFTPLSDEDRLDVRLLETYLDDWLAAGDVRTEDIFGGGALLTGLTAQRENAAAVVDLVSRRLGDALIATADDPRLESWLAFMGSCAPLSRAHPDRPVLNLDIGGGTTNLAIGLNGEVVDTACLYIGARHVRVEPGTYRITALSPYARAIFESLEVHVRPGDELRPDHLKAFIDLQIAMLESTVGVKRADLPDSLQQRLMQVRLHRNNLHDNPHITFTGGVGELIYAHAAGADWPETTRFGDLGIDLAQRIVASPILSHSIATHRPASAGRATAIGLMRYCTEVSGSTLYLPDPSLLPLSDIPIFGTFDAASRDDRLPALIDLVQHSPRGGCLIIEAGSRSAASVREIGERLASTLEALQFPADRPLVLLVQENVGKALGQYVSRWGSQPWRLVVIDEVSARDAQYLRIGRSRSGIVPVSFYGLNDVS